MFPPVKDAILGSHSQCGGIRSDARSLAREQNKCLRVVAGAFRAIPVRNLETETFIPPIDLYLNVRLADFEALLQQTGKAHSRRPLDAREALWKER
jgi:hypothetical protein